MLITRQKKRSTLRQLMLSHQKSSLMMSSAKVPAYVLRFVAFGAFANDNH